MRVKEERGLPDRNEVFEEALGGVDEGAVRERIEGCAEADFVAC